MEDETSRSRLLRLVFLLTLFAAALRPAVALADGQPKVVRFSPRGTVKQVRQVTARFSLPMVPLGDPRANTSPFDIDCPQKGAARWIDSFNWSYDFAQDLPAGVRCIFKLHHGLATLAGQSFASQPSFTFDTGGPSIVDNRPWTGSGDIDEQQAFVLTLDTEADPASILEHASFAVEGIAERVGVNLLSGADRDVLAKRFRQMIGKQPLVILQAKQSFPDGAAVRLIWGQGIKSKTGIATAADQVINFAVRKPFQAKVKCERENPKAGCIPLTSINLELTEAVPADLARKIVLVAPDGTRISPKLNDESAVNGVQFLGPFRESAQYKIELPPNLVDDSGRALANAAQFPYPVATDVFPPLAKFSARFGIIESADPVLPVTVRDLEAQIRADQLRLPGAGGQSALRDLLTRLEATLWRVPAPAAKSVLPWLRRVASARRSVSLFAAAADGQLSFAIPKPNGPKAFEVMGIPLKRPGLYIVELKSEHLGSVLMGAPKPMYVPTATLVTNLAVHFKQGKANSLVWVTALESGRPVGDADVVIANCSGDELWSGRTDPRGIALVPHLDALESPPQCASPAADNSERNFADYNSPISNLDSGVLVTARRRGDFSFVHSSWKNGIESWRYRLPTDDQPSAYAAHTVFDRTLFRAGETVHMKHFVRTKTLDGFGLLAPTRMPTTVSVRYAAGDQHYDSPVTWNPDGTAEGTWKIPSDAKLGEYQIVMAGRAGASPTPSANPDNGSSSDEVTAGSFRVEEFRVPLMKVTVKLPAGPQVGVTQLSVDLSAAYLSGGAAKGLPVTLRSQINPSVLPTFSDFDGFTFANGAVKEGVFKTESFDSGTPEENPGVHQRQDLTLDAAGGAVGEITAIPRSATPQEVRAELEFRDPNGESQTVSNSVTIWPARLLVGIRPNDWASSPGAVQAQIAVVDDSGKPVANTPVQVAALTRKYYSYRKRLVGGFYAYENTQEVKRVGNLCGGTTDARGLVFCDAKPGITGECIVQATVTDSAGNQSVANTSVYIPGEDRIWFQGHDDDRIDVLPESPEYQPGDTARFQVRMPFSSATALVTVEREGVVAASVIRLSGKNPVISLPVRDYAPNVFVSVLVVRGRLTGLQPTAMVDLGKPAFKLGIAEIRVGWRDHQLKVEVTPDRTVYHVRDKARVKVTVRTPDGRAPASGSNVAIAAVDEGLLELKPNQSWKLLDAMMGRRPYQVETSTAEMQVIGKRHYGLKAIPPGGGGGRRVTRELFDTLLFWKAVVLLDSNGEASVEIRLNDSLTSFRIVAVAAVGSGQFGMGAATIRSTQDLMLFSGISPIARTGDSFAAEFTVRNASDHPFEVTVNAAVDGLGSQPAARKLSLGAGEGKTIDWNVAAPPRAAALKYHVDAIVEHGPSDHLLITQQIIPAVPVKTWQATLLQLDQPIQQPIALPTGALPAQGGVQVTLSPSLTAGLGAVREWMRAYPYICLEQRVSRAVALHDPKLWQGIIDDLPSYTDSDGLLKYFPLMQQGSDVLTSYFLAIANEAGLALPAAAQTTLEDALRNFIEGKLSRSEPFAVADLPLRKLEALEALSRYGKVDPALLGSLEIAPNLWPDSAVIDWWSVLLRTNSLPDRARRLDEVEQIMRARLNSQGTAMHLATDSRQDMWWLMVSPDRNMARLTLLLLEARLWHDDLPRLMRGTLGMQARGAWPSTITNAWGTLAIEKFAAAFESTPVAGLTAGSLAGASQKLDWSRDPQGGALDFAWPPGQSNLALSHSGSGSPWAEIRTRAAIALKQPFSSGYTITKKLSAVDANHAGGWKQGDLVRVHLKIDAQADMTWVVVDDPIPAGASHLGTGLGRDSQIATAGEKTNQDDQLWPAFVERPFEAYRAYYDYVPKGTFEIEYTIRLNQPGTFELPATHVQALYQPEMLGELPNAPFAVGATP